MFKRPRWSLVTVLIAALPLMVASCSKKSAETTSMESPPASAVSVTSVDLGKSIGADNKVTDKTDTFKPSDVIYATVVTNGAAPTTVLKATWTFQDGQVVSQSERTIAPNGETATEFHIEKADGFPAGKYKIDVSLDGNPVQTKEFEVKAS
jgi:flagellar hook assembly protein FlgD